MGTMIINTCSTRVHRRGSTSHPPCFKWCALFNYPPSESGRRLVYEGLSIIAHRDNAESRRRHLLSKLKDQSSRHRSRFRCISPSAARSSPARPSRPSAKM